MMKTILLRAFALFFFAGLPVAAEIIGVETFDYANGNVASQNGGTFWDYKNTAPAGRSGTASTWDVLNPTPTFDAGQLVTSGNAVAKREYNGFSESDGAISAANVAKTVYYRVNVTTGLVVSPGDYFGISSVNAGTEVFYFGKRGVSPNWAVEQVGVGGTNGSLAVLQNQTYTLVAEVDLDPPGLIRLYVNPNLSAAQSANTPTASQAYSGTAASTGVRFAAGTAVRWDNLVVATTWEELQVTVVTTAADENGPDLTGSISLREAVNHSPPGSTILFAPALNGQTCTLSTGNEIVVTKKLTLDASSLSSGLTIDGGTGTNRLFSVNTGQSLTLRGLTLTGGNAGGVLVSGIGGAIFNSGTLTLTQCTLSGNAASINGGAILNSGTLTLTQCTLSGNSASYGGAIFNEGTLTLAQCTLSGNRATGTNTSNDGGGAIAHFVGTLTLTGCILAGNTAATGTGPDLWKETGGTITAATGNLIGDGKDSTLTASVNGNFVGTTAVPIDPKLSPLGYFGGPVQTMHPLIGSPAIDAIVTSDPGGTDARGFPRLVDGDANGSAALDIGAVEAGPLRTVAFSSDAGSSGALRGRIGLSTEPGARLGFFAANFPAQSITLNGTQLDIPATANGLFIDASNLSGPVTISGNSTSPSRVFNIPAGATVAMHSVKITGGNAGFGDGGGILNNGTCSVMFSTLSGNSATFGGGILNEGICTGRHLHRAVLHPQWKLYSKRQRRWHPQLQYLQCALFHYQWKLLHLWRRDRKRDLRHLPPHRQHCRGQYRPH
ncbi:MAG: hypothetical protein NTV80_14745 [Verrucomicrobia bacterium]|nr:hypothetical protein [Verrucomicrobiota bacterium]